MDISNIFCHAQLCKNDHFTPHSFYAKGTIFLFLWYLARNTDEVDHPWSLSPHGEFLGVLSSNFAIF